MSSVKKRLAQYREQKSKNNRETGGGSSSFTSPAARPRASFWENFLKYINKKIQRSRTLTQLSDVIPALPVIGWVFFLKALLWTILLGLFIELEFGMVYILFSMFAFIYTNTRTGEKLNNEPSAYSVFNPNCERIQGSLTAEQFESEIGYRGAR